MNRSLARCCIALALCALAMAASPRTEMMFIVFTCVYAFILGFCFAAFGAVVRAWRGAEPPFALRADTALARRAALHCGPSR